MRFQVPQFIEVEDKIFGPLTFKQFIYIGGAVGIAVILFLLIPRFLAIIIGLPIIIFGAALAFYKMNDKPFINMVEAFVKFQLTNKLYIWKKEEKEAVSRGLADKQAINPVYVPKLSESKLKDLTWSLDIKENSNPVTPNDNEPNV